MTINVGTVSDTWSVRVTNPDGKSSNLFSFSVQAASLPAPVISGVSPNPVTATGSAQPITISGNNFQSNASVYVQWSSGSKTLSASEVAYNSASQMTMTINVGVVSDTWYVRVTNPDGKPSNLFSFSVQSQNNPSPPVITSASAATATQGQSFQYQITATNSPTSYGAAGLPAGLGVNSFTGLISGTPTVSGTFSVTLSATNNSGTGQASLELTISALSNNLAPIINGISPSAVTGATTAQTFTVTGGNFKEGAKVQLGYRDNNYTPSLKVVDATFVGPAQLTVRFATGTDGDTWRVKVQNPDNQVTNGYINLVVNAPPAAALSVDRFAFGTVTSPQSVGVPFGVSIAAVDTNGQVVSAFNGRVDVSASSAAKVTPTYVTCSNGRWSGNISLDQPGYNTSLRASNGGILGSSNQFEVRGAGTGAGRLQGLVKDEGGAPISQADVRLSTAEGTFNSSTLSGGEGYRFDGLTPGTYIVSATGNGLASQDSDTVTIPAGATVTHDIILRPTAPPPVLLVPGMMGSTVKAWDGNNYPILLGEPGSALGRNDLVVYDTASGYAWGKLMKSLRTAGFNAIPCPWDWRVSVEKAYRDSLMSQIDKAKRSPSDKVSIVAHSLGGLMVRAYIQSPDYRHDINKLAIMGSPSRGTAIVYYIAEGADPVAADKYSEGTLTALLSPVAYFYTNSLENLYYGKTGKSLYQWVGSSNQVPLKLNIATSVLRTFIDNDVPTARQLLPTFPFLRSGDRVDFRTGYSESVLWKMETSPSRFELTNAGGEASKVRTEIFYSPKIATIFEIPVGNAGTGGIYEDGVPSSKPNKAPDGDGTVLQWSARASFDFVSQNGSESSSHARLMDTYSDQITAFLKDGMAGELQDKALPGNTTGIRVTQDAPLSVYTISLIGRVQPALVDSQGRISGIDLNTGDRRDNIPNSVVSIGAASSGIKIVDPASDVYELRFSGIPGDDIAINISITSGENSQEKRFRTICGNQTLAFQFTLDPNGNLILLNTPPPPNGLRSEEVAGFTQLSWDAVEELGPVEYKIYARSEGQTQYALIGTTSGTSFASGHPWNSDGTAARWDYVIVVQTSDGRESYFTQTLSNSFPTLANFSSSARVGPAPLAITFTDTSLGHPTAWAWDFDADGIIDSTEQNPTHTFSQPGIYTVSMTATGSNGADSHTEVSYIRVELPNSLGNISTRLPVQTDDNVLIGGFIVTGAQPKRVIVRGIGPSLSVPGALADPMLELRDGSGALLESNDNWVDSVNKQAIIDSTVSPTNNLESAIVRTLPANGAGYTAILRGANGGTGIGVVEAYDLDNAVDSKLANISTRGLVQTGDNVLIAGTIVVGQTSQKVILRGIGPSLSVPGKMADPTLELRDGNGVLLEANDNWQDSPNKQAIIDSTIPPSDPLESAILRTLTPGNYTAILRGVNNTTGIAVVEVYALN